MHVADNLECSNIALFILGKTLFISIDANSGRGTPKNKTLWFKNERPPRFLTTPSTVLKRKTSKTPLPGVSTTVHLC